MTTDKLVRTPAEKESLGKQHQALACDMESYAIADVCRQKMVRSPDEIPCSETHPATWSVIEWSPCEGSRTSIVALHWRSIARRDTAAGGKSNIVSSRK